MVNVLVADVILEEGIKSELSALRALDGIQVNLKWTMALRASASNGNTLNACVTLKFRGFDLGMELSCHIKRSPASSREFKLHHYP